MEPNSEGLTTTYSDPEFDKQKIKEIQERTYVQTLSQEIKKRRETLIKTGQLIKKVEFILKYYRNELT